MSTQAGATIVDETAATIEKLNARLDTLERDNKVLRWVAAALFVGAIALVGEFSGSLRKEKGKPKVIEAEKIVVRDRDGKVRASFGMTEDEAPSLKLFDGHGTEVASLDTYADASARLNFSHKGLSRASLATKADGTAQLQFLDPGQTNVASLFSWQDGTSGLFMNHEKNAVMLGVQASGEAGVLVNNRGGTEKARLGTDRIDARTLGLVSPIAPPQEFLPDTAVIEENLIGPPLQAVAPAHQTIRAAS